MSDDTDEPPPATLTRPRWPGLVWAIPLAALIIVGFIGIRALANRGIDAVISFDKASGVKVGETKVLFQGYEIGHVTDLDVDENDPKHHILAKVRLDRRSEPVMRTGTVFWLIGAKTSLTDPGSIKAAFSGAAIGIAPSETGEPTRHFTGLEEEPAILPGTPGTPYILTAETLGAAKKRSPITYRGQEVGKVTATALTGPHRFRIDIFILKPFDRLVRAGARFWPASAVKLSLGAGGANAQLANPSEVLGGGIEMDVPDDAPDVQSPRGATFVLASSRAAAEAGPSGPAAPFAITFAGPGGDLAEGAPVTLLGFPVGEVTSRALAYDPRSGLPVTHVVVGLRPERLRPAAGTPPDDPAAARGRADAAMTYLLARGFRAKLVQSPPLFGPRGVTLVRVDGAGTARLGAGTPPQIPAVPGGGDIGDTASSILGKLDRVPIEAIGRDVAASTARLHQILASPKVDASLDHLQATLAHADAITAQVDPQIGPLVASLRQAADQAAAAATAARGLVAGDATNPDASLPHAVAELSDAATSLRALADGLARHPEVLLKGKGKKK